MSILEKFIIYKKNSVKPYLCKGNSDSRYTEEYFFRKNDVTVFLTRKEAVKFYKKIINDEFFQKSKSLDYFDNRGWTFVTRQLGTVSEKEKIKRIEFNKKLKAKLKEAYVLQPVSLGTRILTIEKIIK